MARRDSLGGMLSPASLDTDCISSYYSLTVGFTIVPTDEISAREMDCECISVIIIIIIIIIFVVVIGHKPSSVIIKRQPGQAVDSIEFNRPIQNNHFTIISVFLK
ncbi:hypothetical protein EYF80_018166 [Liparis tanakae]|uniref:Uncharacterized protein n=1 Tax=Liparis tanakae TaxID=230148 RepID=A0A4Z2I1D8_9TELE|nr:hypothetical protein EYF80_018166 [Liparis tanakae]